MKLLFLFSLASAVATASAALPVADLKRDTPVDFAKDLYPVLKKNCLACHNTTKAKGGLNLESPAAILQGGDTGPAAVAGRSSESLLFQTASHQEDPVMPPAGNKVNAVNLTPAELALLQLWIDQGATGGGDCLARISGAGGSGVGGGGVAGWNAGGGGAWQPSGGDGGGHWGVAWVFE